MLDAWSTYPTSDYMVHHAPMEDSIEHKDFLCPCKPEIRADVQDDGFNVVWLFKHHKMKEAE